MTGRIWKYVFLTISLCCILVISSLIGLLSLRRAGEPCESLTPVSWQKPVFSHCSFHSDRFWGTLGGSATVTQHATSSCMAFLPGPSPTEGPRKLLAVQSSALSEPTVSTPASSPAAPPHLSDPHARFRPLLCFASLLASADEVQRRGWGVANPAAGYFLVLLPGQLLRAEKTPLPHYSVSESSSSLLIASVATHRPSAGSGIWACGVFWTLALVSLPGAGLLSVTLTQFKGKLMISH